MNQQDLDYSSNDQDFSVNNSSNSNIFPQQNSSNSLNNELTNHRSLSLVDRIEFFFEKNISKHGVVLGDCDNDGKNELIIGTLNGELSIFKDDCGKALVSYKDLGMIACVLVGDILNVNSNNVIVLSIEGQLKIFDMQSRMPSLNSARVTRSLSSFQKIIPPTISDNEEQLTPSTTAKLTLIHQQPFQANALVALIVDLDNDGQNEFVVALSDRVVRSYRAIQNGEDFKLIGLYKWELTDQIGSISLFYGAQCLPGTYNENYYLFSPKKQSILVSQFGGAFAIISCSYNGETLKKNNETNENLEEESLEQTILYFHSLESFMSNPQINAEMVANIEDKRKDQKDSTNLIAMVTQDGFLVLFEKKQEDEIQIKWKKQLEYPVLRIAKHDVNRDGCDELIICTWNGLVYVIDLDGKTITTNFHQPVAAFTVGRFDLTSSYNGDQTVCLVCVSYTNSIFLYHDIDRLLSFNIDTKPDYFIRNIKKDQELFDSLEKLVQLMNHHHLNDSKDQKKTKKFEINSQLIRNLLYET